MPKTELTISVKTTLGLKILLKALDIVAKGLAAVVATMDKRLRRLEGANG